MYASSPILVLNLNVLSISAVRSGELWFDSTSVLPNGGSSVKQPTKHK